MNPPTGRLQPRRVGKTWYKWQKGGNPWKKIPPQGMEIPNLPMHAYGHMGEKTGKQPGSQQKQQWSQILLNSENRGESLAKFWKQGSERPNPPTHTYVHRGVGGSWESSQTPQWRLQDQKNDNWKLGGNT